MKENKLIAEFMGYKLVSCNHGKAWDIGKCIPSKDHLFPIQGVLHTGNELKFHTSWDWLMPVVAKCHEENSKAIRLEIGHRNMYGANISIVYEAVVEFINQYNKNK